MSESNEPSMDSPEHNPDQPELEDLHTRVLNAFTHGQQFAYLFLSMSHLPDNDIHSKEIAALVSKYKEWFTEDLVERDWEVASEFYVSLETNEARHNKLLEVVKNFKVRHEGYPGLLKTLIMDLNHIIKADGKVLETEVALLKQIAELWEVSIED